MVKACVLFAGLVAFGLPLSRTVPSATPDRSATIVHLSADGTREYFRRGLRHRDDGPAIERPDGSREWWRGGMLIGAAPQSGALRAIRASAE